MPLLTYLRSEYVEQQLYYYHGRGCLRGVPSFLLPSRVVHREKKSLLMDAGGAEIIGLIVKSDTESHTYTRSEELARRCIRLALWHLNLEALLPSSRGRIQKNTRRRHPKSAARCTQAPCDAHAAAPIYSSACLYCVARSLSTLRADRQRHLHYLQSGCVL